MLREPMVRAYIIYAGVRMIIFVQLEPTVRSLYAKKRSIIVLRQYSVNL
ncbi:hypothetical protein OSCI_1820011 [Kamptonema sp. PCC 6506]|nr:hypothetical protein OSCI_1820011 [Kamptonema sp. PCC 6506]